MTSVTMDETTGTPLIGDAAITQAIRRLLATEHSLILRRHLASGLQPLVDEPMNEITLARFRSVIAQAILEHEPRCDLRALYLTPATDGVLEITIEAVSRETGKNLKIRLEKKI